MNEWWRTSYEIRTGLFCVVCRLTMETCIKSRHMFHSTCLWFAKTLNISYKKSIIYVPHCLLHLTLPLLLGHLWMFCSRAGYYDCKKFANLFCLETIAWLLIIIIQVAELHQQTSTLNVFRNLNIQKLTCHRIHSKPIYSLGSHTGRCSVENSNATLLPKKAHDYGMDQTSQANEPTTGRQLKKVKWLLGKQHVLQDINFLLAIHSFDQFTWNDQVSSSSVFLSFLYLEVKRFFHSCMWLLYQK